MKKILVFFILSLFTIPLFASFSYGYFVTGEGVSDPIENYSINLGLTTAAFQNRDISLDFGIKLGFDTEGFNYNGFSTNLKFRLFGLVKNPFNLFFPSDVSWSPSIRTGVEYNKELYYRLSLSLLHFMNPKFTYEILTPSVFFSSEFHYSSWALEFIRVSYYF